MKVMDYIYYPIGLYGRVYDRVELKLIAMGFDDLPPTFRSADLTRYIDGTSYRDKQELLNRLFQRWRKLGLVEFNKGRWKLTRDARDKFQRAT